jgi:hypothetical protein
MPSIDIIIGECVGVGVGTGGDLTAKEWMVVNRGEEESRNDRTEV